MTIYNFIHAIKSGGTTVEVYFDKYYNAYITGGVSHLNICTNDNNPELFKFVI